jgi:hypothetical protein
MNLYGTTALVQWRKADIRQKAAVSRVLGQQATTQEGRLRAIWPFVDLKKCPANGSAVQNGLTMAVKI